MKFEQLFLLSNVFNNGFIETLFREAEFNGIDEKMSAKKKQNEKIEPVNVFLFNFI